MFSAFKETSKIKILSFIGTAIDGKSLDCFSHNPVEALDLENTKFSDADFQTLAKFKSLRDLDLELNNITGSKFQVLAQLPKLAELDISKCPLSFNGYINLVLYGRQIKKIYLTSQFAKNSDNPIDVLALKLLMPGTQIYFEKPGIEYTPGDIELIY
jgi:hypothetical protein